MANTADLREDSGVAVVWAACGAALAAGAGTAAATAFLHNNNNNNIKTNGYSS